MTIIFKSLKKTLALGDGETSTSFAARISSLWRTPSSAMFWDDVGIPFQAMANGDEAALGALASVTGASLKDLMRNSPVRLSKVAYRIGNEVVSVRDLVRGRIRLCPLCAQEDILDHPQLRPDQAVHGRLAWQAIPIVTCHKHNRSIIEIASDLPLYFGYHDFGLRVGHALRDVEGLIALSSSRVFSDFERYFLDRLEGRPTDIPLLDGLRLDHVASACLAFGRVSLFGPRRRQATMTEHDLYLCRQEGYEILVEGPSAIGRMFRGLVTESTERFTRSHTASGTLGRIFDLLDRNLRKDADADQLKTVVAREVFAAFPMAGGEVLFGIPNASPAMLTVHDVERRYGISWFTATRVAKLAGVLKDLRPGDAPGPKVIAADDAERLFARFVDVVSVTVLAQEIGATQKQLIALGEAGILKPAFDRPSTLMSFWRPDVDEFLSLLAACSAPTNERQPNMASIQRATWRSAPKFVTVISGVLEGRIRWLGQLPNGRLLQKLLIQRGEVADLFEWRNSEAAEIAAVSTMCQTELCERWKVKSEAVVELVGRKVLVAEKIGGRGRRYRISEKSVKKFEGDYVSVKMLALQRGQSWASVKAMVDRHGIDRAFPGIRGCFYPRKQLKRANLI